MRPSVLVRQLRVHHWTKNVLVFVPLLMSHQIHDSRRVLAAVIVFVSFCFASSATYIFNDIIDLQHDRSHRSKNRRPLSAGEISRGVAIAVMLVCAAGSLAIAALMAFPGSNNSVDGISNADRAPLVADYLKQNFKPAFDQDGVVFWVRSTL